MSMNAESGRQQRSEINVTPLIDVLLVLLIIFMVIVPVAPKGLDARILQPPTHPESTDPSPQTIVVQVLSNGTKTPTYKINDQLFGKAEIESKLASIFSTRAEKTMFVRGEADLEFSSIAEVIDYGHQAGVANIGILTSRTASLP